MRRVVLVEEAIARTRHLAVRQVDLLRFRPLLEEAAAFGDARRQPLVENEPLVGERDRRRDQILPLHLAAAVVAIEVVETGDDAGNVRRGGTVGDDAAVLHDRRIVGRRLDRRHVLVFDGGRLLHALQIEHRRSVAADTGRFGLDDAERERNGDHRVDDVAAFFEREAAGFRRQRMPGDDHGAARRDHRLDERLRRDHLVDDGLEVGFVLRRDRARTKLVASRSPTAPPSNPSSNTATSTSSRRDRTPRRKAPATARSRPAPRRRLHEPAAAPRPAIAGTPHSARTAAALRIRCEAGCRCRRAPDRAGPSRAASCHPATTPARRHGATPAAAARRASRAAIGSSVGSGRGGSAVATHTEPMPSRTA